MSRRNLRLVAALVAATSLWGCAGSQTAAESSGAAKRAASQVPALAFFESDVPTALTLSPNGRFVAGILTKGAEDSVIVVDTQHIGEGTRVRALTSINRDLKPGRSIDQIAWANDDMIVVGASTPAVGARIPSRESRILVVDVQTGEADYLTKDWPVAWRTGFRIRRVLRLPDDPDHVLLVMFLPRERFPSVRRLNVRTGDLELVQKAIWGVTDWGIDHQGHVRAGDGASYPEFADRTGRRIEGILVGRATPDAKFERLRRWVVFEEEGLAFAGFAKDPGLIYIAAEDGPERTRAIYEYDIDAKTRGRRVFGVPHYDAWRVVASNIDGRPLFISYDADKPELESLDPGWVRLQGLVDRELPDRVNEMISRDQSETRFIFTSYSDVVPPEFYLIDSQQKTMDLLFVSNPKLPRTVLSPMIPVRYSARDGLPIYGYLTRPKTAGSGPGPVIVLPHGGPYARDVWGFDPLVQFLASRGFAVFQMNFRGSTGYGADFVVRGYGEWGLTMQEDIADGTEWLIDQGIADPNRIGIFGGSYGGYAALQGLVDTPELYRAGASWAGVTDLPLMLLRDEARRVFTEANDQLVGNRRDDKDKLVATSPAFQAARIEVPVLLGHGTGDSVVDFKHATRMVKALRTEGAPVELIVLDDETHGFLDPTREAAFFERVADFFEAHLLGATSDSEPDRRTSAER